MKIEKISFENFRNLEDGSVFPDDNINVIWGNNAQGKTNLLEAVWLFTGGHSFRGNKDAELIRLGVKEKKAKLDAVFFSGARSQTATLNIMNGRRSSVINGVEKKTGSALVGKVCAVIFSPEHLMLIKEGPQKRRSFIDGAICQIKPSYAKLLSQYNRSVSQRNALLKDLVNHPELGITLDVWDERIIYFGSLVIKERLDYIKKLTPTAEEIYRGISRNKEKISIKYIVNGFNFESENPDSAEIEEKLRAAVEKNRQSDIRMGCTNMGPHRDDIDFMLDGLAAKTFGSQGQQRSVVLSLKLAEAEILEKGIGEAPIILLDDVMSELDSQRQDYLLNHLSSRQVFITCCSPETVNLMEKGKKIYVEGGRIS
ncbi:MAG: DNA replication/repair protein RecF [Clostridia bacterium]|nr:DNA replication/repair protein RecF [Clostridia bacterium]